MVQKAQLQGAGDGTTVPAGYVGERINGTLTNVALSNAARVNCANISLTAGTWLLFAEVASTTASMTGTRTLTEIAESTTGTNQHAQTDIPLVPTSVADVKFMLSAVVTTSVTKSYYANVYSLFSAGSGTAVCSRFYGIRIA